RTPPESAARASPALGRTRWSTSRPRCRGAVQLPRPTSSRRSRLDFPRSSRLRFHNDRQDAQDALRRLTNVLEGYAREQRGLSVSSPTDVPGLSLARPSPSLVERRPGPAEDSHHCLPSVPLDA